MKANCKSDDLEQLKLKCEILVRDCIAGLLIQLSNEDFKKVEGNSILDICMYIRSSIAVQTIFRWIESSCVLVFNLRSILGRWSDSKASLSMGFGVLYCFDPFVRCLFLLLRYLDIVRVSVLFYKILSQIFFKSNWQQFCVCFCVLCSIKSENFHKFDVQSDA